MFDIIINPIDRSSDIVRESDKDKYLKEFASIIEQYYRNELLEYIDKKRYKDDWRDIDTSDLKMQGLGKITRKVWKSIVSESISSMKFESTYKVGVSPTAVYTGTSIPILTLVRKIEFGTSKIPARPLYSIVGVSLSGRVPMYWDMFLTKKKEEERRKEKILND